MRALPLFLNIPVTLSRGPQLSHVRSPIMLGRIRVNSKLVGQALTQRGRILTELQLQMQIFGSLGIMCTSEIMLNPICPSLLGL